MSPLKLTAGCLAALALTAGTIWAFAEPTPPPITATALAACPAGKCGDHTCSAAKCETSAVAESDCQGGSCPKVANAVAASDCEKDCEKNCDEKTVPVAVLKSDCEKAKCDSKCQQVKVSAPACSTAKTACDGTKKACHKKKSCDKTVPVSVTASCCEAENACVTKSSGGASKCEGHVHSCNEKYCEAGACKSECRGAKVSADACPTTEERCNECCDDGDEAIEVSVKGPICDGARLRLRQGQPASLSVTKSGHTETISVSATKSECEKGACPVSKKSSEASACPLPRKSCDSECCKNGSCETAKFSASKKCSNDGGCEAACPTTREPVIANPPRSDAGRPQAGRGYRLRIGFSFARGPEVRFGRLGPVAAPKPDAGESGHSVVVTTDHDPLAVVVVGGAAAASPPVVGGNHPSLHYPPAPRRPMVGISRDIPSPCPRVCPMGHDAPSLASELGPLCHVTGTFDGCPRCAGEAMHGHVAPPPRPPVPPLAGIPAPPAFAPPLPAPPIAWIPPPVRPPVAELPPAPPRHRRNYDSVHPTRPITAVSFEGDAPAPGVGRRHRPARAPHHDHGAPPIAGSWVQESDETTVRFTCEPSRLHGSASFVFDDADHETTVDFSGTCSVTPDGQLFGVVDNVTIDSADPEANSVALGALQTRMIDQPFAVRFRTDGEALFVKDFKCAGLEWLGDSEESSQFLNIFACGKYTRDGR